MNSKEYICLKKIQEHASKTIEYCSIINSAAEFQEHQETSDACAFNLLQIGELAKTCLSNQTKAELNNIPWQQIQGLRNRIVHGYDGVRMNIVFDTIKSDLPALVDDINNFLNR